MGICTQHRMLPWNRKQVLLFRGHGNEGFQRKRVKILRILMNNLSNIQTILSQYLVYRRITFPFVRIHEHGK